jgi:ribosomal protein S18 acetylase RimI-like enzyme
MTIRKLTSADIPQLRALAIKIFRDTFTHLNTPEAMEGAVENEYNLNRFEKEFKEEGQCYYFISDNDRPIGYLRLRKNPEVDNYLGTNHIELQRIYVDQDYHGQKVGDKLMQLAIDIANENNYDWIWLGVWEKNPRAQRFYQKWGFEKFSEHDFYMGEERQTDWLMKKNLKA